MPKKISAGTTQDRQRREEVLVAAAAELDAVLFELAREVGIDPRGHEAAGSPSAGCLSLPMMRLSVISSSSTLPCSSS